MKRYFLIFAVTFFLAPTSSGASDFSYNFIQAVFVNSDTDFFGIDIDGDGYAVGASFELTENVAFSLGLEDYSYDFDFETNGTSFGLDYHTALSESSDLVLGFAFLDAEVSQPVLGSEDDSGNVISIGIRNKVSDSAELGFAMSRADIFDDTSTSYGFEVIMGASEELRFIFGYVSGEDTDAIAVGIRSNF